MQFIDFNGEVDSQNNRKRAIPPPIDVGSEFQIDLKPTLLSTDSSENDSSRNYNDNNLNDLVNSGIIHPINVMSDILNEKTPSDQWDKQIDELKVLNFQNIAFNLIQIKKFFETYAKTDDECQDILKTITAKNPSYQTTTNKEEEKENIKKLIFNIFQSNQEQDRKLQNCLLDVLYTILKAERRERIEDITSFMNDLLENLLSQGIQIQDEVQLLQSENATLIDQLDEMNEQKDQKNNQQFNKQVNQPINNKNVPNSKTTARSYVLSQLKKYQETYFELHDDIEDLNNKLAELAEIESPDVHLISEITQQNLNIAYKYSDINSIINELIEQLEQGSLLDHDSQFDDPNFGPNGAKGSVVINKVLKELKDELIDKTQQVEIAQESIVNLEHALSEKENQVKKYMISIAETQNSLDYLELKLKEEIMKNDKIVAHANDLENELKELKEKIHTGQMTTDNSNHSSAQIENTEIVTEELNHMKHLLEEETQRNKKLENDMNRMKNENSESMIHKNKKIKQLEKETHALKDRLMKQQSTAKMQINEYQIKIKELTSELEEKPDIKEKIDALKEELMIKKNELESQENRINELEDKVIELQNKLMNESKEKEKLANTIDEMKTKIAELEENSTDDIFQNLNESDSSQLNEELNHRIQELQNQLENKEQIIIDLENQIDILKSISITNKEQMNQDTNDANEEITSLKEEISALKEENSELKEEVSIKTSELESQEIRITELEDKLFELQKTNQPNVNQHQIIVSDENERNVELSLKDRLGVLSSICCKLLNTDNVEDLSEDELNNKVQKIHEQIENLVNENKQMKDSLKQTKNTKRNTTLISDERQMALQVENYQKQIQILEEKIINNNELNEIIDSQNVKINSLQKSLENSEAIKQQKDNEIEDLKNQILAKSQNEADFLDTINQLQIENNNLRNGSDSGRSANHHHRASSSNSSPISPRRFSASRKNAFDKMPKYSDFDINSPKASESSDIDYSLLQNDGSNSSSEGLKDHDVKILPDVFCNGDEKAKLIEENKKLKKELELLTSNANNSNTTNANNSGPRPLKFVSDPSSQINIVLTHIEEMLGIKDDSNLHERERIYNISQKITKSLQVCYSDINSAESLKSQLEEQERTQKSNKQRKTNSQSSKSLNDSIDADENISKNPNQNIEKLEATIKHTNQQIEALQSLSDALDLIQDDQKSATDYLVNLTGNCDIDRIIEFLNENIPEECESMQVFISSIINALYDFLSNLFEFDLPKASFQAYNKLTFRIIVAQFASLFSKIRTELDSRQNLYQSLSDRYTILLKKYKHAKNFVLCCKKDDKNTIQALVSLCPSLSKIERVKKHRAPLSDVVSLFLSEFPASVFNHMKQSFAINISIIKQKLDQLDNKLNRVTKYVSSEVKRLDECKEVSKASLYSTLNETFKVLFPPNAHATPTISKRRLSRLLGKINMSLRTALRGVQGAKIPQNDTTYAYAIALRRNLTLPTSKEYNNILSDDSSSVDFSTSITDIPYEPLNNQKFAEYERKIEGLEEQMKKDKEKIIKLLSHSLKYDEKSQHLKNITPEQLIAELDHKNQRLEEENERLKRNSVTAPNNRRHKVVK
ncbi:hypothetical protein TRFO_13038 [Tritrichomonas foetus]|uniref:Uncharacterized protein n=1 Tax=Tritrichomonas foetus TaxID=1144522 RepID=A0A1J4KZE3_9EUKA|nr:hypothetical protein TRFO_13038 [Tritrichomonas foetus]|eukprot:OHT16623.1 hypothetical protein TRFO_13038 [Tritrichomonas foetus]